MSIGQLLLEKTRGGGGVILPPPQSDTANPNSEVEIGLKKRLWHWCFPVNFVKFTRIHFEIEHLWTTASVLMNMR